MYSKHLSPSSIFLTIVPYPVILAEIKIHFVKNSDWAKKERLDTKYIHMLTTLPNSVFLQLHTRNYKQMQNYKFDKMFGIFS